MFEFGQSQQASLPQVDGYEIQEPLGSGGAGTVFRAREQLSGRDVAIKFLRTGREATVEQIARLRIEGAAVACLRHRNIAKIRRIGAQNGFPFLVVELLQGGTLKDRLARNRPSISTSVDIVRQLAAAMDLAHQRGIVHRDLKPANVLFDDEDTPKISDFGLAAFLAPMRETVEAHATISASLAPLEDLIESMQVRQLPAVAGPDGSTRLWEEYATTKLFPACDAHGIDSHDVSMYILEVGCEAAAPAPPALRQLSEFTRADAIMGTPAYMSPEQAAGRQREVGPATDIFALGVILYELLTGCRPYTGRTVQETLQNVANAAPPRFDADEIPTSVREICESCLRQHPGDRIAPAGELASRLNALTGLR